MTELICEHCRIGIAMYGLYGRVRVYECVLNKRHKKWLAGFEEPCDGAPCTTSNLVLKGKGKDKYWDRVCNFPYKLIPIDQMQKSEDCLKQEREEKKEREEKAAKLRKEAEDLLLKARELDKTR